MTHKHHRILLVSTDDNRGRSVLGKSDLGRRRSVLALGRCQSQRLRALFREQTMYGCTSIFIRAIGEGALSGATGAAYLRRAALREPGAPVRWDKKREHAGHGAQGQASPPCAPGGSAQGRKKRTCETDAQKSKQGQGAVRARLVPAAYC